MITMHGVFADSPRKVFQKCFSLGITNKQDIADLIDVVADRNLTAHVYNADLANKVAFDIQKRHEVIDAVIKKALLDMLKK